MQSKKSYFYIDVGKEDSSKEIHEMFKNANSSIDMRSFSKLSDKNRIRMYNVNNNMSLRVSYI